MSYLDMLFDGHPRLGYRFETFEQTSMAPLVVRAGVFPSVTIARKNGWNIAIPPGFSHHVIGKRRVSVAILNPFDGWDDDFGA